MNPTLSKNHFFHVWLLFLFNISLHWPDLPVWASGLSGAFLLWRLILFVNQRPLPSRWLRWPLAVFSFVFTVFQFGALSGQEPATALLVILISLKLLETLSYRDFMVCLMLAYVLLASKLLASQTFLMTLVLVADVIWISVLFFMIHQGQAMIGSWKGLLRAIFKLLIQASPLIVLLFFLFPRFTTGFWSLGPTAAPSSGFDDELSPGEISELVLSNELAFRARFPDGERPPLGWLYWRGGVLSSQQGMTWSREKKAKPDSSPILWMEERQGREVNPLNQEITLEPRFKTWLFGLDSPRSVNFSDRRKQRQVFARRGQVFETRRPIGQRVLYTVQSQRAWQQDLSPWESERYLGVNLSESARVQQFVDQIRSEGTSALEKSRAILRYFRREGFTYTLSPGELNSANELEDFLFNKKRGFCEHYASAYSLLMRLSGVPSRVIIGFQGGRYNELDNYFIVTNQDAHAWSEYWDEESLEWVRVDPTQIVAPLRLSLGGQQFYELDFENLPEGMDGERALQMQASLWQTTMLNAWLTVDAMANRWNLFLLRYDFAYQQKLLKELGFSTPPRWVMTLALALMIALFVFWFWRRRPSSATGQDLLARSYGDLCAVLSKQGLEKKPAEGALTFLDRCQVHRPGDQELRSLLLSYIELRYTKNAPKEKAAVKAAHSGYAKRVKEFKKSLRRERRSEHFTPRPK